MSKAGDTRQKLVASARDLYLDQGLAGLSMRKVARAAGVSAPAIYRHFADKEALLTAVCEEGFELFASYLWRGLQGSTPRDRLRRTGQGYLDFGLEQAAYYRVMFMSPVEDLGFEAMPEAAQVKMSPTFRFLADRVRECIAAGDIADGDPEETAANIWSHCHGLVSLYLSGHFGSHIPGDESFAAFFARSTDSLIRGLAPGSTTP